MRQILGKHLKSRNLFHWVFTKDNIHDQRIYVPFLTRTMEVEIDVFTSMHAHSTFHLSTVAKNQMPCVSEIQAALRDCQSQISLELCGQVVCLGSSTLDMWLRTRRNELDFLKWSWSLE